MVAISSAHGAAGPPSPRADPNLRKVLRGIRRTLGVAQKEAAPALAEHLRRMVGALPASVAGLRDRALLLVGFAGDLNQCRKCGGLVRGHPLKPATRDTS